MDDGIATIRYLTTASFGHGAAALLPEVLAELGIARPFVVTDPGVRATGLADRVVGDVEATWFDRTPPNPTDTAVTDATGAYVAGACDGVVAIGGGSSIDLAKGVALLATHPGRACGLRAWSTAAPSASPPRWRPWWRSRRRLAPVARSGERR